MATPRIQSVDRAFALLAQLAQRNDSSSLPVMAERSGLSVATAHRLLATLEALGAVIRTGPNGYRIGMCLHELTRGCRPEDLLAAALQPVLAKVATATGLTVHAGLIGSDQMVTYIAKYASKRGLPVPTRVGSQLEAYCSGIGKVLLAHLDPAEQHAYLIEAPFVPLTARTLTDPEQLRVQLVEARKRGYAVDDREIHPDLRCVAVPVHGGAGEVIAAVSCAGSAEDLGWARVPEIAEVLKTAAMAVHSKLFPGSNFRIQ